MPSCLPEKGSRRSNPMISGVTIPHAQNWAQYILSSLSNPPVIRFGIENITASAVHPTAAISKRPHQRIASFPSQEVRTRSSSIAVHSFDGVLTETTNSFSRGLLRFFALVAPDNVHIIYHPHLAPAPGT